VVYGKKRDLFGPGEERAMKKVVKKQLKGDEFVSTMTKIWRFFEARTKEILIGVAVVVFIGLLYAGVRFIRAQQIRKESRLVSQLLELRSSAAAKPENLAALEKAAGEGKYARLGYVLTATYWVERGDLEKAKRPWAGSSPRPGFHLLPGPGPARSNQCQAEGL
jgi:hypothetical protein